MKIILIIFDVLAGVFILIGMFIVIIGYREESINKKIIGEKLLIIASFCFLVCMVILGLLFITKLFM